MGSRLFKKIRKLIACIAPYPLRKKYWRFKERFYTYWYLKSRNNPIIVYQIGKVGSTSVYRSLLACGVKAVHFHKMKPAYIKEIEKKKEVRIITLVRDPIARQISGCFENFETWTGVGFEKANYDVAELCDIFINKNYQPPHWFDTEMKKRIGVDIYAFPFPQKKGYTVIRQGRYKILVLKTELDDTIKERIISEFLGLDNFELIRANTARNKVYAETYDRFKQTIRLPRPFIERMLNARYTKHFYNEAEIEAMREKYETL